MISTNRAVVVIADYFVNREVYRALCENKDKPELDCDGCCQVKKNIAEESEHSPSNVPPEQRRSSQLSNNAAETLHPLSCAQLFGLYSSSAYAHYSSLTPSVLAGVAQQVFQPPRV
jgi:hypothetical protein